MTRMEVWALFSTDCKKFIMKLAPNQSQNQLPLQKNCLSGSLKQNLTHFMELSKLMRMCWEKKESPSTGNWLKLNGKKFRYLTPTKMFWIVMEKDFESRTLWS